MFRTIILSFLLLSVAVSAYARDDKTKFSIKDALNSETAKSQLNPSVKLFFGGQKTPKAEQKMGEYQANKKTNAFNKTDVEACQRAFISALITLQNRASREGGNAIINIRSNYKRRLFSSKTEFECGVGNVMAGVTLKGEVAKLAE